MTAIEKVIQVAKNEIGYLEKATNSNLDSHTGNAGYNNWTKYARDLAQLGVYNGNKNGYHWCDVFVDWCFIKAFGLEMGMKLLCQPMGGLGAGCEFSMKYYKAKGQLKTEPKPGDQIFFSNDGWATSYHTGLVIDVRDGRVYTIEGNTSAASGVVANGGGVAPKSYPISYGRYGRPDYSLVEGMEFEEDDDMNVERFRELWLQMREGLQDNDSAQWSKEARDWAINSGLITGGNVTATGEPNYMWEDVLTREQMATILYRFAKMMGKV